MRWVRAEQVLWRKTMQHVVVLARRDEEPFQLAGTGVELWEALTQPVTTQNLAARLAAVYDLPARRVAGEILPVLEELEERGAVCCLP